MAGMDPGVFVQGCTDMTLVRIPYYRRRRGGTKLQTLDVCLFFWEIQETFFFFCRVHEANFRVTELE